MTREEVRSELIKLAAECYRAGLMPPEFVEDWNLPKSTPLSAKREIQRQSLQVRLVANGWGKRIKELADKI